jgi:FtsP/CotA-like multicopper oxidase with cupredoxin domain
LGQWLTVNGKPLEKFPVTGGQRGRLRVVNTANARVFTLSFGKLQPHVIALDGQPVTPRPLGKFLTIAPAQRADLLIDMAGDPGESASIDVITRREVIQVAQFVYDRTGHSNAGPVAPPFAGLPANPLSVTLDLAIPVRIGLLMEGGAMGGMRSAMLKGKRLSIQELIGEGAVWAFNQTVGMTDTPLVSARRGQTVVIEMRNQNRWPHAMHLHGHHFRVIEREGNAVDDDTWRDTELVQSGESVSIAFVADNPGKWLLHCHMLEHQVGGMTTWLEVA